MKRAFNIPSHYDAMHDLDRDVHDDTELAASEAQLALSLLPCVPRSVFLPCVGTGRHIAHLLRAGVRRIVGVDLSRKCLEKAAATHWNDERVELLRADLIKWETPEMFDAAILLGNSYGDITDPRLNAAFSAALVRPLKVGGTFVMDYIGRGYLDRCREQRSSTWNAVLWGQAVKDKRTPRFDADSSIMTIDIEATDPTSGELVWKSYYQKLILTHVDVAEIFAAQDMSMRHMGAATDLNPHYASTDPNSLGMIARSTWWRGVKRGSA